MASIAAPPAYRQTTNFARFLSVWPAVLILVSFLIPPEVGLNVGPLRLGVYRLVLIALSPLIVSAILKGRYSPHPLDFIVFILACWFPVSFAMNYDWGVGLEAGGSQSFDLILSYLLGRVTIRTLSDFRNFLICILPALLLVGLSMVAESLTGSLFVRETANALFGSTAGTGNNFEPEFRNGLLRSYSVFTHPIHAGLFLSSFISLYYSAFKLTQWKFSGALIGVLGFFSLSSAALLGIVANMAILIYDWVQQKVKNLSWPLLIISFLIFMSLVHFFSQSGVVSVIYRYLTFNAQTGYYRTLIWEYAGAEALRHPWFGIGYEEYTRPVWMGGASIDAHYLFMATSYGFVPALLYFFIAIITIFILARRASKSISHVSRSTFLGLAASLTVIVILLFTVTFWGSMLAWFNFTLGFGVALTTLPSNLSDGIRRPITSQFNKSVG